MTTNNASDTNAKRGTATSAYAAARKDIARLLDVLDMELAEHDAKAKADEKNWGFAGSLQKVRSDLIDIAAFLSGADRKEIEDFLDTAV